MQIIIAAAILGAIGLVFGLILNFADKKFHVEIDPRIEQVRGVLAGANCGACGYPGCDGYAEAVVKDGAKLTACTPGGTATAKAIGEIMGVAVTAQAPMVARVLCQGTHGVAKDRYIYDGYTSCRVAAGIAGGPKECRFACIGLGDCIDHCSFNAISIHDGVAVIDEHLCRACGNCVDECPRSAIALMPVSAKTIVRCRNSDVARVARNVCMHACIGCGRCTKECKYDAIHVEDGFAHIDPNKCTRCGECAKVCPCQCITIE